MTRDRFTAGIAARTLGLLLALVLGTGQVQAATHSTTLADLPDNTWAYLNPDSSWRYIPVAGQPDAVQQYVRTREPFFREFSGVVYGDGRIFYFGGAHGGYPGNDIEVYDIGANIWRQMYKPEVPPAGDPMYGSGGTDNISPTGKPYTIHGYARTTYDPVQRRYVCTNASSIAAYDPAANQWTWLAGVRAPGGVPAMPNVGSGEQLSMWDPQLGGLLLSAMYNWNGVWVFRSGRFDYLGNNGVMMAVSGGAASIYIPVLNAHLYAVLPTANDPPTGHLYLYYSATNRTVEIQSVPSALRSQFSPEGDFVMAYDSSTGKVVCMSPVNKSATTRTTQIQVWIYDPLADAWQALPISSSSPLTSGWTPGQGRSILQYDPIYNVFILVIPHGEGWQTGVETWAYRYRRSSASSDTVPPLPVTDLRPKP